MSAFGGKADMAFCEISLSRSLLGVKRTWAIALHMFALTQSGHAAMGSWTSVQLAFVAYASNSSLYRKALVLTGASHGWSEEQAESRTPRPQPSKCFVGGNHTRGCFRARISCASPDSASAAAARHTV